MGSTNEAADSGKDDCGVCAGDGSTCADCAGTANGDMELDECGDCRLRSASNWNTG